MPLTLIYGEAGTGKSEYCVSAMQELFSRGISSIMIVPEQFAHSAESRLIEKNGFLSDEISATSFKRLAFKTLSVKSVKVGCCLRQFCLFQTHSHYIKMPLQNPGLSTPC